MLKTQLETDVTEYYRNIYRNVIDGDIDALLEVLDDGFTFERASGETADRDEFLEELRNETIVVNSENVERVYVKKDGDILNVRGRSKLNLSVDGEKRRIRKIQVDLVLKKTGEEDDPETGAPDPARTRWRVLSAKADIY